MIARTSIILVLILLFSGLGYAAELLSEEAFNHYNEGVRAQKMRNFYRAQTSYQKAIILDRSTQCKKFIFNNLGVIYAERGEVTKAELAFKEALKLDPDYQTAAFNLTRMYLKLAVAYKDRGNRNKSLEFFEKAFSYYPTKAFIIEEEKKAKADNSGS
ncbi:MAG: tetratricopeptide repeat protein [Candidatus Omnitrophota bacterium]|jgi:tetratricopeptide (TPR) repeat protein